MNFLQIMIYSAGAIMLARSALFWLYFIQMKHYRLDRIWLEVKQHAFWRLVFSRHRLIILAFLLGSILLFLGGAPLYRSRAVWLLFVGLGVLSQLYILIYAIQTVIAHIKHRLKVPQFTPKSAVLTLVILLIELPFALYATIFPQVLFITEFFQPIIVLVVFTLAYTPNIFLHRYFINRAKKKIAAHKKLTVIGITGSYGKTSTKEFLAHILSKKFKVLKTPAHINVDTGVAKVVLRDLTPEHEIFVVEMGAYREGEIRKICELMRPHYAVLTGLSDQHLELFGSLKAISEAKFELVAAVREPGYIIANRDSKPLIIEFERRGIAPIWYGISAQAINRVRNLEITATGLHFMLGNIAFHATLFGTAALNNLLGAITAAQQLGLELEEIAQAVSELASVPHTMELRTNPSGAFIIDDTYNANTDGVIAALQDLQYTGRQKRVIVFSEVIELGDQAKHDHARIAATILGHATHAMLLPSRLHDFMRSKLITGGYLANQFINSAAELKDLLDEKTVVLFEGRDAQKLLNSL